MFHFRDRRRLILSNDVLFAPEIPKELILLGMDYDVALRLENLKVISIISLKNFEEVFQNSRSSAPQPWLPYLFTLIKDF